MRTLGRSPRRGAVAAAVAAVVGLWAAGGAASAATPFSLERSSPAADEQLTTSPTSLQLVFNNPLPSDVVVEVVCGGAPGPTGPTRIEADQRTVTVPVVSPIARGKCNVLWQVPQVDGSVSQGNFSFDVLGDVSTDTVTATDAVTASSDVATGAGTDTGASDDNTSADGSDPTVLNVPDAPRIGGLLGLARLATYVGLAALFGGLILVVRAWPEGIDYRITLSYFKIVWVVALIGSALCVIFTTARFSGISVGEAINPTSWSDILDTNSGKAILARFALIAGAGYVALRPDHVLDPASQPIALGVPALAVATYGFTRVDAPNAVIGVPAGIVHALSISVWFGGLLMLSRVVLAGSGEEDLVHAVRGHARMAGGMLVLAVVSGGVLTYQLDAGDIFGSPHGRMLLLKVVAVAAMAYVASSFRQFVMARLGRARGLDERMAHRLRRAVGVEVAFGVLVLGITSWMVSTVPPQVDPPGLDKTTYVYVSPRSAGQLDVQVMLAPATVGRNQVRVELYAPTEGVTGLVVTFNPPVDSNGGVGVVLNVPITGAAAAVLPGSQGIPLNVPGVWTIEVSADGPAGRLSPATFTMTILDPSGSTGTTTPSGPATSQVPLIETTTTTSTSTTTTLGP